MCDDPFSLFKPHDHDHGPVDASLQFEGEHLDDAFLKRSDSVNREGEEMLGRPSKKSKNTMKEKREPMIPQSGGMATMEHSTDLVGVSSETATESKPESMLVDPIVSNSEHQSIVKNSTNLTEDTAIEDESPDPKDTTEQLVGQP